LATAMGVIRMMRSVRYWEGVEGNVLVIRR
jgi:hypothetical protein